MLWHFFQCPCCEQLSQRGCRSRVRASTLFSVVVISACISTHTHTHIKSKKWFCTCVWNDPVLFFCVYLSRSTARVNPDWIQCDWLSLLILLPPTTLHFLVHWLNFLPLVEYRGRKAKSSKGFFFFFFLMVLLHRYIGLSDYSVPHCKWWRNVHMEISRIQNTDDKICTHAIHSHFLMNVKYKNDFHPGKGQTHQNLISW